MTKRKNQRRKVQEIWRKKQDMMIRLNVNGDSIWGGNDEVLLIYMKENDTHTYMNICVKEREDESDHCPLGREKVGDSMEVGSAKRLAVI